MNENSRIVWSIPFFLSKSKNTSYRESVLRRGSIVFKFFWENALIKKNPLDEAGKVREDLIVYVGDLSPEGLKMLSWDDCAPEFKLPPVLKWHNYLDRGGKEENISHLVKGLQILKGEK